MMGMFTRAELKQLEGIISGFEYGRYDLIGKPFNVEYNPKSRRVRLNNFDTWAPGKASGVCQDLTSEATLRIRETRPDYNVIKCQGNDPAFFSQEGSEHDFLIVSKERIMDEAAVVESREGIEGIVAQDPALVDPSFGIVAPLSGTGYRINKIFGPQADFYFYRSPVSEIHDRGNIGTTNLFPIGITATGLIAYLGFLQEGVRKTPLEGIAEWLGLRSNAPRATIGIQEKEKAVYCYLPQQWQVKEALEGSPELALLVKQLTCAPIKRTSEKLEEKGLVMTNSYQVTS